MVLWGQEGSVGMGRLQDFGSPTLTSLLGKPELRECSMHLHSQEASETDDRAHTEVSRPIFCLL